MGSITPSNFWEGSRVMWNYNLAEAYASENVFLYEWEEKINFTKYRLNDYEIWRNELLGIDEKFGDCLTRFSSMSRTRRLSTEIRQWA